MSFINALTSYALRKKILPTKAYAMSVRTKPGLVEQSIIRDKITKPRKDPFAGLSTRKLYMRRPIR